MQITNFCSHPLAISQFGYILQSMMYEIKLAVQRVPKGWLQSNK